MHLARNESVPLKDELPRTLEASFERVLAETEDELAESPRTRRLVPLQRTVGRQKWRERKALLQRWAATLRTTLTETSAHSAAQRAETSEAHGPDRSATPTSRIVPGSERSLVAPEARLSARVDLIQRDRDGTVHITDFKTGSVRDRDGNLFESYALQMRLYALAVEEVEPDVRVRLWLEGAERVEVPWDETFRSRTRETLREVVAILPADRPVPADALAREGPHCGSCRIRHRCSRYLQVAPTWWTQRSSTRPVAPFDVWGTVLDLRATADLRSCDILIRDAAGRKVRISGLETDVELRDVREGYRIWFFGLQPSEILPLHGSYTHPRNFHGRRPTKAWTDALQLQVFVERE